MAKIRVLLADDHPVVRAGIRAVLERTTDIVVVAEAVNGAEALRLAQEHVPDVLILDIEMPEISGIEVVKKIKEQKIPVRVLVLSAYADNDYIHEILSNGAFGYLIKDEASQMILDAVRGVAMGETGWMSRRAAAELSAQVRTDEDATSLTPREKEVLCLIADGKTNREIALILQISESTVEKHASALFLKLDVSSRAEAAVHAVRAGLI